VGSNPMPSTNLIRFQRLYANNGGKPQSRTDLRT